MPKWTETVACIRVVVFEEGGAFSAQCLDYDVAAQSSTLLALHEEIARVLAVHVAASHEIGKEPFSQLGQAPERFWHAYEIGSRIETKPVSFCLQSGRSMPSIRADMRLAH